MAKPYSGTREWRTLSDDEPTPPAVMTAFDLRVQLAAAELSAGIPRPEVRSKHGSIVLSAAESMFLERQCTTMTM